MDLSPFFQSPETSFHKYNTHLHFPSVLHPRSYHLYFCFHTPPRTRTYTVFAAAFKELRKNKLAEKRQISAAANTYANQSQCTEADIHEQKRSHVFFWNKMIRDYVKNGSCDEALRMYYQMQSVGIEPDKLVFISVINACSSLSDLQAGRRIHKDIIVKGFELDVFVGTALVSMYVKCGCLEDAWQVFDKMLERDVVSWNAVIAGYFQHGYPYEALTLFNEMQVQGIKPSPVTMVIVLPICIYLLALEHGRQIHGYVIRCGFESDVGVGIGLVDLYAKCGIVGIAHKLFERMPKRNVVAWTAIIAGYSQNGQSQEALALFERMPQRNVVSWNAIIAGYSQNGQPCEALTFFSEMQVQHIKPNLITIISVLPACADLLAVEQGKQIHAYAVRNEFEFDVVVGTALVDMYTKCGNFDIAHKLFERMPKRNVVSWTAIIAGYSQNDHPHQALAYFNAMQVKGIKPNSITMTSILPACADLLALEQGKQIHGYVIRNGFESDVSVGNALVKMYAKCGFIGIARQVFDKMSSRDVVSWNVIILGYACHGHGEDALASFSQMQLTGTKPDHITFVGILTACSHAGLVDRGWQYFQCMESDYGLVPNVQHYACVVDILGRAGHLDEAHEIIKKMPSEPNTDVWAALLGASKIHCNIKLGEQAAQHLFELEPDNAGYYVLLSNIYAEAGRWEDVAKLRTMMKEREVKRRPGCSFIEINKKVHAFLVGDRSHPQSEKIYAMLETLYGQMKNSGYVPNTNLVLQDVEEVVKENILFSHSEKLAIAFGIINTSPGHFIRMTKNLRVCSDCHNATKFISKIVGREIIMRDASRFHHFRDGLCSCGDYW